MKRHTASSANAMTGTLIAKTEPHQKFCRSNPPTIGPSGSPTIVEMLSTRMARGRSGGSNSTTTADIASGISTAAPRPSTARAAIRLPGLPASAHHPDPSPKTASAISVRFLRPNRSPSIPAGSITAAITSR